MDASTQLVLVDEKGERHRRQHRSRRLWACARPRTWAQAKPGSDSTRSTRNVRLQHRGEGVTLARLLPLGLLAAVLVAIVFVTSAASAPSPCTHGSSSIGPAVLIHNQLAKNQSNLVPHTEACLPN
jgi:Zn-dependent protease